MCGGSNLTITNCTGKFDACQTTGLQLSTTIPKMKMVMRLMTCSVKVGMLENIEDDFGPPRTYRKVKLHWLRKQ